MQFPLKLTLTLSQSWWGRCEKKLPKEEGMEGGREGGEKKHVQRARRGPGLKPGICCVLGEGPQLHAMGFRLDKQAFPCL